MITLSYPVLACIAFAAFVFGFCLFGAMDQVCQWRARS
jgi:hypothetical protein